MIGRSWNEVHRQLSWPNTTTRPTELQSSPPAVVTPARAQPCAKELQSSPLAVVTPARATNVPKELQSSPLAVVTPARTNQSTKELKSSPLAVVTPVRATSLQWSINNNNQNNNNNNADYNDHAKGRISKVAAVIFDRMMEIWSGIGDTILEIRHRVGQFHQHYYKMPEKLVRKRKIPGFAGDYKKVNWEHSRVPKYWPTKPPKGWMEKKYYYYIDDGGRTPQTTKKKYAGMTTAENARRLTTEAAKTVLTHLLELEQSIHRLAMGTLYNSSGDNTAKLIQIMVCFMFFVLALCWMRHMYGGQLRGNNQTSTRDPPSFDPDFQHQYNFTDWSSDIMAWSIGDDRDPRRKATAVRLQLRGPAKLWSRKLDPNAFCQRRHAARHLPRPS